MTSHPISWSADGELALAIDSSIHILFPDISLPWAQADLDDDSEPLFEQLSKTDPILDQDTGPQYSLSQPIFGVFRPDPAINERLCADHGLKLPPPKERGEFIYNGVGKGPITGSGGGINQVVRVEWSPPGLGCNLRPVLAALCTHGHIMVFGEHLDPKTDTIIGMNKRGFSNWKILWGIGASLSIPSPSPGASLLKMDEKIIAFSWAKEIETGRSLLAYMDDEEDISIMTIQHYIPGGATEHGWKVEPIAKFCGSGPHEITKDDEMDFAPCHTAFALNWSPWVVKGDLRTATLAYISHNFVGFRRVIMQGDWNPGEQPLLRVEDQNTTSICLYLSSDATVDWEDHVSLTSYIPWLGSFIVLTISRYGKMRAFTLPVASLRLPSQQSRLRFL